jgi:hypothetical protein
MWNRQSYPVVVYPPLLLGLRSDIPKVRDCQLPQFDVKITIAVPNNTYQYLWVTYLALVMAIACRLFLLKGFGWLLLLLSIFLLVVGVQKYLTGISRVKFKAHTLLKTTTTKPRSIAQQLQGKIITADGVSLAPAGVSEAKFKTYLEQYFSVKQNLKFDIPGSTFSYTPDFLIVDETGIVIDVEIDEPYEGKSKQPHHCIDKPQDRKRDEFFRKGNIVTLRFAEEQIVTQPLSCCKLIVEVLNGIKGGNQWEYDFVKVSSVTPINRWNTKQAKLMAKQNYRQKYL